MFSEWRVQASITEYWGVWEGAGRSMKPICWMKWAARFNGQRPTVSSFYPGLTTTILTDRGILPVSKAMCVCQHGHFG